MGQFAPLGVARRRQIGVCQNGTIGDTEPYFNNHVISFCNYNLHSIPHAIARFTSLT